MLQEQLFVSFIVTAILTAIRLEFAMFWNRRKKEKQGDLQKAIYDELVKIREAVEPKG
jgi:hypothetical protein